MQAFSSGSKKELFPRCSAHASHCDGFSCYGAQALGHAGFSSACAEQERERASLVKCEWLVDPNGG